MTNPQLNPHEPSRERVAQQTAIKFLDSVGLATGGVSEDLLTAEINATLIRETEKLRGEIETWAGRASQYVTDEQTHGGTHKELSDRIAALEAQCAEKDEALSAARAVIAINTPYRDMPWCELLGKLAHALTDNGNTLLERVKGLEKAAKLYLGLLPFDHPCKKSKGQLHQEKVGCSVCETIKALTEAKG